MLQNIQNWKRPKHENVYFENVQNWKRPNLKTPVTDNQNVYFQTANLHKNDIYFEYSKRDKKYWKRLKREHKTSVLKIKTSKTDLMKWESKPYVNRIENVIFEISNHHNLDWKRRKQEHLKQSTKTGLFGKRSISKWKSKRVILISKHLKQNVLN